MKMNGLFWGFLFKVGNCVSFVAIVAKSLIISPSPQEEPIWDFIRICSWNWISLSLQTLALRIFFIKDAWINYCGVSSLKEMFKLNLYFRSVIEKDFVTRILN